MAENGFAGSFGNTTTTAASSVTYYGNYGNSQSAQGTAETTEANASLVHRGSNVTLKDLRVIVATNSRAAQSSVTTRLNAADTALVATITASTTGTYTDLTDTVSVTAGDTVGYKLIVGSTSGSLLVTSITANHESAGQAFNFWAAAGSVSYTTASVTRYLNPVGNISAVQTTDAAAQTYAPAAGTISNLRIYVTAARATATTVRSRVGAANGAQSVSVTGTGAFEDTSNSDTLAAANLFNYSVVTGTGADTLTIVGLSYKYTPSTADVTALGAGPGQQTLLPNSLRYYPPSGFLVSDGTESRQQVAMPYAGTLDRLSSTITANLSTTTATFVLRVGGVDSAVTYTVAAGATGSFADTTNSVSVAAADLVSIKGSGADANITIRSMGVKLTALPSSVTVSATGVSATGSIGDETVSGGATYTASSVSATGSIGGVSVPGKVTYTAESVSATGSIGEAVASATVVVALSYVSATGAIGEVVIPVYPTGVSATGAIGEVAVPIAQTILAASVYATGYVSSVLVWGPIDTSQTANWVEINT